MSYRHNILLKTKILTNLQVYVLSCLHFTAISSVCHLYSVLAVKSSFCEHRPSKNGHSFKSCNDTAMKFDQNVYEKWKKSCHQKIFHQEGIDDFLLRGIHCTPKYKVGLKGRWSILVVHPLTYCVCLGGNNTFSLNFWLYYLLRSNTLKLISGGLKFFIILYVSPQFISYSYKYL